MKFQLIALSLLAATACTVDSSAPIEPGGIAPAKITVNSLLPSSVTASNLGNVALTSSVASSWAVTDPRRATLIYLYGCAMPSGSTMSYNNGLTQYTLVGSLGLAPSWSTGALTLDQQQMVSSCVLSRVNYYGQAVSISARGASVALATTPTEVSDYYLDEGAFYGNILGGGPVALHACVGPDKVATPNQDDLQYRICATGSTVGAVNSCNFTYDGLCSDVCGAYKAGHFDSCAGFADVTTTWVQ